MRREFHVRFCEGLGVRFPRATRLLILVGASPGPQQDERARAAALREKEALAMDLKERMGLELSETKTLVTPVTRPMRFLGHHVYVRPHPAHGRLVSTNVVPRDRSQRLREVIKDLFRRKWLGQTLEDRLRRLNPLLRGWGNYYRHAWGAKRVFARLDNYVWWTIFRWLKKRHPRVSMRRLFAQYGKRNPSGWRDGGQTCFRMASLTVGQFKMGSLRSPCFA